jgi:hypothetical protein
MSIDPLSEELLTMPEAASLLPKRRRGAKVSLTSLWRWSTRGAKGVRLETVRVGSSVYTTRAALRRFIESRTAAAGAVVSHAPAPSTRSKRAMRDMERMGM